MADPLIPRCSRTWTKEEAEHQDRATVTHDACNVVARRIVQSRSVYRFIWHRRPFILVKHPEMTIDDLNRKMPAVGFSAAAFSVS
jgi:hypothetical protein